MDYLHIVYFLLFISYTIYLLAIFILAEYGFFTSSSFFEINGNFEMLGIKFQDKLGLYIFFLFFFAIHSFIATINSKVIDPIFRRLTYSTSSSAVPLAMPQHRVIYRILIFYDIWLVIKQVINLLGILSNFGFFISTSLGFLVGDVFINYMYINYPELFFFHEDDKDEPEKKTLLLFKSLF